MAGRLQDKVAIVTGSGSSGPGWGNGKAMSVLFAREGAKVVGLDIDAEAAAATQRIIDEEYWKASITPAALDDRGEANKRYGYFWWLAELDGNPIWYCRGFHGEYVVVMPDMDLVMVRTGMKREEVNDAGHPTDVFEWIKIARDLGLA